MGFINLVDKKIFLIGIAITVVGLIFVVAAIYFYTIQSVDSSKMASFDYEISKPIALNQPATLNQSTQFNNKNENAGDTPTNQNKVVAPTQKPNGMSSPSSNQIQDNRINHNGRNASSSVQIISSNRQGNISTIPTPASGNQIPIPNLTILIQPTSTPVAVILSNQTPEAQKEPAPNRTDSKVISPLSTNKPEVDKGFIEIGLFSPISAFAFEQSATPKNLLIPILDLSADIKPLNITVLNDSLSWETPNRIVGYIPITSTPGELNHGWYFGHYETLLTDEGNIFNDLPEIVELLKSNHQVFVMINAGNYQFLYQVYKTEVVHQDSLELVNSQVAEITLVTCVPKYKYDHRLLVTASLIGVRPL